ncbi:MAG: copper amine oxidase N-terminal domain-containing protein [Bacillota bacterium]
MNNVPVSGDADPYIENGSTLVALNMLRSIPSVTINWNNTSKTVTVDNNGTKSTLVAGKKEAMVGDKKVTLSTSSVMKKGRVMVPLRFIADASGSQVYWNAPDRTVYVAKPTEDVLKEIQSSDISLARHGAYDLPRIAKVNVLQGEEGDSMNYIRYFPKNQSSEFIEQHMDIVNYYRIIDTHVELLWSARLNLQQEAKNASLPFLTNKIVEQSGKIPTIQKGVVYYNYSVPGGTTFGTIDKAGKKTRLGEATEDQAKQMFFSIPEEEQL